MPAAAIPAAAIIGGALIGSRASRSAAQTQANAATQSADMQLQAAREAQALQERIFNQQRADLEPWRTTGASTLSQLAGRLPDLTRRFSMQDFQGDPGYAFRLAEGEKAINRAAAARGLLDSGGTLKALTRYGQGLASDEFANSYNRYNQDQANAFNRLASLAGVGQTAAQQVGQAGQNYANAASNALTGGAQGAGNALASAGAARASGYIGGANAISGGIGQGLNFYNQSRLLDLYRGGGGSAGGSSGGSAYYGGQDLSQPDYSGGFY